MSTTDRYQLLAFLNRDSSYPHPVNSIEHIQTNSSDVFLTGKYVYKIKRAVKFSFLDYSNLLLRKAACEKELQLNHKISPELYLDVVTIYQNASGITFVADGTPVEYAVRMLQFPSQNLFSSLLASGKLNADHIVEVSQKIARFHRQEQSHPTSQSFGTLKKQIDDTFKDLERSPDELVSKSLLEEIKKQVSLVLNQQRALIEIRSNTQIKSLHGDLHLGNICLYQGQATLFDRIEFNDDLSVIDTWLDFSFLVMDLFVHANEQLAFTAINTYLLHTNDIQGLGLLPLFASYRALVRAKVQALGVSALTSQEMQDTSCSLIQKYLAFARKILSQQQQAVFAVGGLSGSGKSSLALSLSSHCGLIHLSSDAIRKYLFGTDLYSPASSSSYTTAAKEQVYAELISQASQVIASGFSPIVDTVFADQNLRDAVRKLADSHNLPFYGLWCYIPIEEAKRRITHRAQHATTSDATVEVLEHQLNTTHPPTDWKQVNTIGTKAETLKQALLMVAHKEQTDDLL